MSSRATKRKARAARMERMEAGWPPGKPPGLTALPPDVRQQIDELEIDLVILGDGSASGPTGPEGSGWAAVLLAPGKRLKKLLHGSANYGSSMLAELMPFVHGLAWHSLTHGREAGRLRVLCVTDCRDLAILGDAIATGTRDPEASWSPCLWDMVAGLAADRYELYWLWAERGRLAANRYCDEASRAARHALRKARPAGVEST